MTNGINLAALGFGGMDTSSLVSSLVQIESQPIAQMQNEQQQVQSASSTISSFSTTLSALKNAAVALSTPDSFSSMKATSSDSSVVATANGTAPPGQWSVSVSSVAQEQRTLSYGTPSSTTALGLSGTLAITVGNGSPTDISINSGDTLSDIAGMISSAGLRVQASLVYDGSNYHLLMAGLDTGAANSINFDESGLSATGYSLGLSDPASTIQSASDAQLTIGGANGIQVTSPTNQITNAIPGVTFAVTQPTTNPVTLSVGSDPTAVQQKVQAFVTAYNAAITEGHSDAGFGTQKASNSLLQGDPAIRAALDMLGQKLAGAVPGTSGAYTTLGSVGISLNNDGTLSLDSTKLASAIAADPTSVERLFVTDPTNGSTGIMGTLGSVIDSMTDTVSGSLQAEINAYSTHSQALSDQMAAMQQRVTAYQTQLQNSFTQMNTMLAQYKNMYSAINAQFNQSSGNNGNNGGIL